MGSNGPLLVGLLALAACSATPPAGTGQAGERPASVDRPAAMAPAPDLPDAPPGLPPSMRAATDEEPLARLDGYGPLRFGMGADEARAAWSGPLRGDGVRADNCAYLQPASVTSGAEFALMFEGGRFVRYDVGHEREVAPGGGRVGMGRDRIESLYVGRMQSTPHEYVPGGQYLRVVSPGGAGVLVFETDAQARVTRWRAGRPPQVDYAEGCA